MKRPENATRRELLVATARAACVVALVGGGAWLLLRNGRARCGRRTACEDCGQRGRCEFTAKPESRSE